MDPPPRGFPGKDFLQNYPAAILVVPTLSLLLGQALFSVHYVWIFLIVILALLLAGIQGWRRRRRWSLLILLSGLSLWIGYSVHKERIRPDFPEHHLSRLTDGSRPVYLEGVFYREPERLWDRSRWYLRVERLWRPLGSEEAVGRLLVTVRETLGEWRYGDRVRFRLRVRAPRAPANPGEFDYQAYLARREIYLTGFLETDASVELLHRETGGWWLWIQSMRGKIRRSIDDYLPGREGAVLKALVIGDREGLSGEDRERFAAAGVSHLLSISGLHVGMLGWAAFLMARTLGSFSATLLLRWNLLKAATLFSFLAILLYASLSGGRIPTIRATIMVAVYGVAVLLDREEEFYSSLALAACIIGLVWPGVIFDISFQLSFLAVLFIVWGLSRIQELRPGPEEKDPLEQPPGRFRRWLPSIGLYLIVPVLATLGTGPVVAYHFGRVSLAGFLANPVLVPLVGFLLVPLGFLIAFVSSFATVLALPLLWLVKPLLQLTLLLVDFFANIPMGSLSVPAPKIIELGIFYLAVCGLLVVRQRRQLYGLVICVLLAVLLDGAYWWRQRWNRQVLRITYLSVGQGDAAVIEFPGSDVLLVDAGGSGFGSFDPGRSIIAPYLRSRRIATLDYVLVSHPRVDHYGGMQTVLKEFSPREFWSSAFRADSYRYGELEHTASEMKIKRVIVRREDPCRTVGSTRLCILYPPAGAGKETSVVLRLSLGSFHLLFPGDIQERGERELVGLETDLTSQVLKVPRHGSKTSSSDGFVAAVRPRVAVFSVAGGSRFGLPNDDVISRYEKRGAKILRTDRDGAITVETDGKTLRYWTHLSGTSGEFNGVATAR